MPNPLGILTNTTARDSLIKAFEGFEPRAYPRPEGGGFAYGYGFNFDASGKDVSPQATITRQQADPLLKVKVDQHASQVRRDPGYQKLSPNAQAAVESFAFNAGPNFFGASNFQTLTDAIRSGNDKKVAEALKLYTNGGVPGLVRRREAEARLATTPYMSPKNSTLANDRTRKDGTKAVKQGKPVTWDAASKTWKPAMTIR
ncbi:hypothetical protein EBT31_23085 [bacterium]|nr:hypothetical protein [bacterium]